MIKAEVNPNETVIVEDSHIGRKGALSSGAYLCAVEDCEDVSYDKVQRAIQLANACGGQEVNTSPLLTTLNTNKIKDLLDVFVEDHNENTQAIAEEMMSKQANKE